MNGDLTWEVQKLLFQTLSSDTELQGVAQMAKPPVPKVVICDYVPSNVTFPFIKIGDEDAHDVGDKSAPGEDLNVMFYLFSRATNNNELQVMGRRIRALFHEQKLFIGNGEVALCRFVRDTTRLLSDAITRQRIITFHFYLTESLPTS